MKFFRSKNMSAKKKTYSADFKAKVVMELLSGDSTLNQIASKYEITPQSSLSWKKQFLRMHRKHLSRQK